MDDESDVCAWFKPDPCISYTNCTGSDFVDNFTDICCQPQDVKNTRYGMLSVIGVIGTVGTVCNIVTISSFIYLFCCCERIKRIFNQEFAMVKDPVFFLILHLSVCDLLYCIFGLPSYWIVHYYGYFPYSEDLCKFSAFLRNIIAYADFYTTALIAAYFAWRKGRGRPDNIEKGWKPALAAIVCVWIFSVGLTSIPLLGLCGHFGFDAVNGRCHMMCSQALIVMAVGDGLPCAVIVVSYSLVYINLAQTTEDGETENQRKAVLILTGCYVCFILPHSIFECLPYETRDRAFWSVLVHAWFWFIYIINFFIYIIFWRRVRKAIQLMMKDILEITGWRWKDMLPSPIEDDSDRSFKMEVWIN